MTINEVYNSLEDFLMNLLPNEFWSKAELNIKVQPKMVGMSGKCYAPDKEISLRTKFDNKLEDKIKWLHKKTTHGGNQKWNKAKFSITSEKKIEMDFVWDQEWQDEIDEINRQAKNRNGKYELPKWHWEKDS